MIISCWPGGLLVSTLSSVGSVSLPPISVVALGIVEITVVVVVLAVVVVVVVVVAIVVVLVDRVVVVVDIGVVVAETVLVVVAAFASVVDSVVCTGRPVLSPLLLPLVVLAVVVMGFVVVVFSSLQHLCLLFRLQLIRRHTADLRTAFRPQSDISLHSLT